MEIGLENLLSNCFNPPITNSNVNHLMNIFMALSNDKSLLLTNSKFFSGMVLQLNCFKSHLLQDSLNYWTVISYLLFE